MKRTIMNESTNETNKINVVLDATMLDTFQSCPAKFNYRFNHNKTTVVKAKPLDRGTLVHSALEAYYGSLKGTPNNWHEAMERMKQALAAYSIESDLPVEDINRAYEVLYESCVRWRDRDLRFEILEVEKSFAYLLHEDENLRIVMIGKIDLLVNFESTGSFYENCPIDHKTYERDFPLKRLGNQFCNYANATKSNYLFVNRIGFQTSIKPEIKHKFIPLSFDPIFLKQWEQNTIRIVQDYVACHADNSWPMNLTSCDKFNRLCEYYEVCDSSGQEAKFYKLNANFNTAEVWDVSQSLGKNDFSKKKQDE